MYRELAERIIGEFLKNEKDLYGDKELYIGLVEESLKTTHNVTYKNKTITVTLKGTIDRLSVIENDIYIIDYKTGSKKDLRISSPSDITKSEKQAYVFQLLFYKYLVLKSIQSNKRSKFLPPKFNIEKINLKPRWYFFRSKKENKYSGYEWSNEPKSTDEFLKTIEVIIDSFIHHLLDIRNPIVDKPISICLSQNDS